MLLRRNVLLVLLAAALAAVALFRACLPHVRDPALPCTGLHTSLHWHLRSKAYAPFVAIAAAAAAIALVASIWRIGASS